MTRVDPSKFGYLHLAVISQMSLQVVSSLNCPKFIKISRFPFTLHISRLSKICPEDMMIKWVHQNLTIYTCKIVRCDSFQAQMGMGKPAG